MSGTRTSAYARAVCGIFLVAAVALTSSTSAEKLPIEVLESEQVFTGGNSYLISNESRVFSSSEPDTTRAMKIAGYDYAALFFKAASLTAGSVTTVFAMEVSPDGRNWVALGDMDSVTVTATPDTVSQYRKSTTAHPQWAQFGRYIITTRQDSVDLMSAVTFTKIGPVSIP